MRAVVVGMVLLCGIAHADQIDYVMVPVGNPGNAADTNTNSLYGAVSYSYQIGKYEVTGSQYTAFLNAVGSTDPYGLYSQYMDYRISRSGTAGTYTYAVLNSTGQRPINFVSWFESARFSNWMSNGQPSGAQNSTTTENGAYNVNGATWGNPVDANTTNPNTNLAPTYRIPLENEWYKAAYYSPNYGGAGVGGYYAYATQSDSAQGTTISSGSFYGTFKQFGYLEWNDLVGTADRDRLLRGVSSSERSGWYPSLMHSNVSFRLASPVAVPEPSTVVMALAGLACGGWRMWRRARG